MRLAKYLAHAGVASRRAAAALIAEGRVSVDDEIVRDPARDIADTNTVSVDGAALLGPEPREVHLVNKPLGVVSTARDPQGRPTVVELVGSPRRLYPVGRLDADTTGLILLTNDGALAHALTHPRYGVRRTYRARVQRGGVSEHALRALRAGVELDDGPTAPASVRRLAPDRLELVIREGRKRQVRRMCEAVGHPVAQLERVAFGPLRLGGLAPGAHRRLTPAELARLRAIVGRAESGAADGRPGGSQGEPLGHASRAVPELRPAPARAGGARPRRERGGGSPRSPQRARPPRSTAGPAGDPRSPTGRRGGPRATPNRAGGRSPAPSPRGRPTAATRPGMSRSERSRRRLGG